MTRHDDFHGDHHHHHDDDWFHGYVGFHGYYGYPYYGYGYGYGYPYGCYSFYRPYWGYYPTFGLGLSFGYGGLLFGLSVGSYYDSYFGVYPYSSYAPIYVGYPYYRPLHYYRRYYAPYAYSYYYNDCYYVPDYYVGFGPYRRSYYVADVPVYDVEIAESAPAEESAAAAESIAPPESGAAALEPSVAYLATLTPAQRDFAYGFMHLKNGQYQPAAEAFYSSTLAAPDSRLAKLYLGVALMSAGEYAFAAEYLRTGLASWPEFPGYVWNLPALYPGDGAEFYAHLTRLEEHVALEPADDDAAFTLGVLAHHAGKPEVAGPKLDLVANFAADDLTRSIAARYTATIAGGAPFVEPSVEVAAFLEGPELGLIAALPIE